MAVVFLSYYSCRVHVHVYPDLFFAADLYYWTCFLSFFKLYQTRDDVFHSISKYLDSTRQKKAKTKKTKSGMRLSTHF